MQDTTTMYSNRAEVEYIFHDDGAHFLDGIPIAQVIWYDYKHIDLDFY